MNYQLLEDIDLVGLLKNNDDNGALKEIYLRYWNALYHTAYRKTGSKEAAEELVQNIFIGLWNRRKSSDISSLSAYLHTAVKYQVINYLKRTLAEAERSRELCANQATETAADSSIAISELLATIDRAIRQLPEKTQLVFQLNRLQGHSVKEIAQHIDLSEKAVEYHLTKSLKHLRPYLRDSLLPVIVILRILLK